MDRWTGPKRSDVHPPMCEVEQVSTHLLSAGESSHGQTGGKSTTSCLHGKSKSQIDTLKSQQEQDRLHCGLISRSLLRAPEKSCSLPLSAEGGKPLDPTQPSFLYYFSTTSSSTPAGSVSQRKNTLPPLTSQIQPRSRHTAGEDGALQ